MWHSVATFESCCRYQIKSVGVCCWLSSHVSEASVSSPACFIARIAIAVSRTLPQLSEDILLFSSVTQVSKMLSGVARIVSATSWVVRDEQSSAFVSRHWNPSSVLLKSCWDSVDVSNVSFVSLSAASVIVIENNSIDISNSAPAFFIEEYC